MKLPPLQEVDKDLPQATKTELNFPKCNHDLYLVSSTEARCKKCPVGWTGHNIVDLIKAFQQN